MNESALLVDILTEELTLTDVVRVDGPASASTRFWWDGAWFKVTVEAIPEPTDIPVPEVEL